MTACVFPPVGKLPNPAGHAFRENLGMKLINLDVDGPKKVAIPQTPKEMAKPIVVPVTASHNQLLDMYSFQEKKREVFA